MKTFSILAAAVLSVSGFAQAADFTDVRSVTVRYGDLNLNSKAGVASLHKRIRNAAESACSPLESRILGFNDAYVACVDDAVNRGVAEVGNANLSNFHTGKTQGLVAALR